MPRTLKKCPSWTTPVALTLTLCTWTLNSLPAAAQANGPSAAQLQQINHSLTRTTSQDFFEAGNRQIEQEINLLIQRTLTPQEDLLQVPTQLETQAEVVEPSPPSR